MRGLGEGEVHKGGLGKIRLSCNERLCGGSKETERTIGANAAGEANREEKEVLHGLHKR